jgi:hypothetical protein
MNSKQQAKNAERRQGRRIECAPTLVPLFVEGLPDPVEAEVVNVSVAGLGLRVQSGLPLGSAVHLELKETVVAGHICYCVENESHSYDTGVEIADVANRET